MRRNLSKNSDASSPSQKENPGRGVKNKMDNAKRVYYFVISNGNKKVELFKIEKTVKKTVITSALFPKIGLPSLHTTFHKANPPFFPKNIIQLRGRDGTLIRKDVGNPSVVEFGGVMINLKIDWKNVKSFAKKTFSDKYVHDITKFGEYTTTCFFQGKFKAINLKIDNLIREGALALIPKKNGFGTPPPGHNINYVSVIFGEKAEDTIGVLFLGCQPPPPMKEVENKWKLPNLQYAAFAVGKRKIGNTND